MNSADVLHAGARRSGCAWAGPLACLVPALLAALWFSQTARYGYVWDDDYIVSGLRAVLGRGDLSAWATASFLDGYFRPLPLLMLGAEQQLGGGEAWLSHLANALLHGCNTAVAGFLAAGIAWRVQSDAARLTLTAGAALFYGFHPALIEGVSWIAARFDLLFTLFAGAALLADQRIMHPAVRAVSVALACMLAALCKEMVAGLALLLPLWQLFCARIADPGQSLREVLRQRRWTYLACAVAALAYLLLRAHFMPALLSDSMLPVHASLLQALLLAAKTFGRYELLALWPFPWLSVTHYYELPVTAGDPEVLLGLLSLLLMIAAAIRRVAVVRQAALLAGCFFLALFPVLQLLPVGLPDSFAAERFLQFPMMFAALGFGLLLAALMQRTAGQRVYRWLLWTAPVGWSILAIVAQIGILPTWHSEETLWVHAYEREPRSRVVTANLLALLIDSGDHPRALAFAEQVRQQQGGRLYPNQQLAYAHLLELMGRGEEAMRVLQAAQSALAPADKPGRLELHRTWGLAALNMGDLAVATQQLELALVLEPGQAQLSYYLGIALLAQGQAAAARQHLDLAYAAAEPAAAQRWRESEARNADVARAKLRRRELGLP